ncbi:MAG: PadR family transcriptional regulator [Acidobacteriota bacterium]|jgi:DNA-binding PadR family transcriptional regulator
MSEPAAADLLPLKPIEFHILLVLLERDVHGYALVKQIEQRLPTTGKVLPGALYRTLNRLEELGLIEESDWRPDPTLDDERRRYFRLTGFGRRVAAAEAERLEALVTESRAKNLLAPRSS